MMTVAELRCFAGLYSYYSYDMNFVWTLLVTRFSEDIISRVFNVGHQGAVILHVVLYS